MRTVKGSGGGVKSSVIFGIILFIVSIICFIRFFVLVGGGG